MISTILNKNWHNVENIGINPALLAPYLNYDTGDNPITRGIHLTKHDKGKVFAYVKRFDVANERHAQITVGTHRHGGETFTFNSFKESRADKQWVNYSSYPPVKSVPQQTKPQQDDNEWRLKAFESARKAFESANSVNVSTHAYIVKKGVSVKDCDIRRTEKYNDAIIYPIRNILGVVICYQTIDKEGFKRYHGGNGGGFAVIGNAEMVQFGAIFVEGLAGFFP